MSQIAYRIEAGEWQAASVPVDVMLFEAGDSIALLGALYFIQELDFHFGGEGWPGVGPLHSGPCRGGSDRLACGVRFPIQPFSLDLSRLLSQYLPMSRAPIQDRIRELKRIPARDLLPHPKNYRKHPERQKKLLSQLFGEIGYADALLARQLPDGRYQLIDGHLRAETTPDQEVPVLVLDVTEAEANKLLLTLDPLAGLAETDSTLLADLLAKTDTTGEIDLWLQERAQMFDVSAGAFPELPSGDKEPFESMTFTLSDRQAGLVKRALAISKGKGGGVSDDNQNSNGNALAAIVEAYLG